MIGTPSRITSAEISDTLPEPLGPMTTDPTKAIAASTTADSANADPAPVKVAADDLDRYVNTSDAEASFAALFAMNVDSLESDIRTATQEAARLDKALSAEPAAEFHTAVDGEPVAVVERPAAVPEHCRRHQRRADRPAVRH